MLGLFFAVSYIIGSIYCGYPRSTEVISFAVTLENDVQAERYGVMLFDKIRSNIGDGFDLTTGKFTAPISGVYAFYATAVSKDTFLALWLIKNNENTAPHAKIYCTPENWSTGSFNAILELKAGDTVHLTNPQLTEYGWVVGNELTQFSGFIL